MHDTLAPSTHAALHGCQASIAIPKRLWVYTNYDCNLSCSYCIAGSHPRAERRAIQQGTFARLIDEAAELGFEELFLTGGEPFLLPDICLRIEQGLSRLNVTVLTNAALITGQRLERLLLLRSDRLTLQISLDSDRPEMHDAYRGAGAWAKAVERIRTLLGLGFHISVGATETPANAGCGDELRAFVLSLGVREQDFFVRPLVKRGFSNEGMEVTAVDLVPEVTVNNDGVYWHPLTTEADLLLTHRILPLRSALELLHERYHAVLSTGKLPQPFR